MKWLAALVLLLFTTVANATDWTYRNGYWWYGDQAYLVSRIRVYENGCWIYRWNYQAIPSGVPTYQDAKWRDKLTEIVAANEKYKAAMNLSALEHAEWLEAVRAIGYQPGTYNLRYATGYAPGTIAGAYAPAAPQGSSVYGTTESYNFYNPQNLDVQWNQADRHVDKAQNLAGEAMNGFREALREASTQEATAKERIAAIYAKAALLKAADTPEITIKKQTFGQSSVANATDVLGVIQSKCIDCHNATNPSGMIDMSKYLAFNDELKAKVRTAITNPDPNKRMPKKKNGDEVVPGDPLPFEELILFK